LFIFGAHKVISVKKDLYHHEETLLIGYCSSF
jgi:hypothetical protein